MHPPTPRFRLPFLPVILVILGISTVPQQVRAWSWPWPFSEQHFSANALAPAGTLGLPQGGRAVAFGDFNGDQFVDVLMLSEDQQTLTVWQWDHDAYAFKSGPSLQHPRRIQNAVPGDFTYDGRLDVLVVAEGRARDELEVAVYAARDGGGFDPTAISAPSAAHAQPITLDANGDMKIDLLGVAYPAAARTPTLQLWQNVWNASTVGGASGAMFTLEDPDFTGQKCTLASPHSNAVVDFDGDCLADVFLMCDDGAGSRSFQIWVNGGASGYRLARTGVLPAGTQAVSFADMDRDGTIDMVLTTCGSVSRSTGVGTDCALGVAYNRQLPLCAAAAPAAGNNGTSRKCRTPGELCVADPNFAFNFTEGESFSRIPISTLVPSASLLVLDTSHNPPLPLAPRLGDPNLDGFPDVLLVTASSTSSSGSRTPALLYSISCSKGVAGCSSGGRRGFRKANGGAEALDGVTDARGVAFVDIDEDGTLDILVQRTGAQGEGTILFVQNNFYYDAFFLKVIVLNGACDNGLCTYTNQSGHYNPFGVSYSGASYKYTVLDTSGRRSAAQVGQLPQTSYHALQTPYVFFGLGRTNNYIENLFAGSTGRAPAAERVLALEGVVPNSRVVLLPPPAQGGGAAGGWRKELFLRPGRWIPWVTLTAVVTTALLGGFVLLLQLNEKREDELERRRASHHINFDAL